MATTTRELTELQPDQPVRATVAWPMVAAVTLLVVLLAEVGARALSPHLPPVDHWNQREAAIEYDQMRALAASGGVEVAWLGSSVAHFGFEPEEFSRITGRSAYNAALPGSGMRSIAQWSQDFVEPMLRPKTVIIGLTSRDLNDNGPVQAEHLDSYLNSDGRRRALGIGSAAEKLERRIEEVSALVRLRQHLRRPASAVKDVRGQSALVREVALGARGEARFPEADYPFSNDAQRQTWEREALQRFDMTSSMDALRTLIDRLRAKGVRVVLVDMPVVEDLYAGFHPNGRADLLGYRRAIAGLGAPVISVGGSAFDPDEHFVDSIHLNRAGARAFSRTLASRLAAR